MDKENTKKFSVETLIDALGASEDQSIEEVKEELREDGIDVDAAMKLLLETVRKCSMASRRLQLDLARESRREQELSRPNLLGKFRAWTREQIIDRMAEIANASSGRLSLNYRDLEGRSIEDMKTLLEDMEIAFHRDERNKEKNGA